MCIRDRSFARALSEGAFGAWDELVLPLMNGEGPMPTLLTNACREVGLTADTSVTNHAPYITLPPSWDDYLTALTGKHRQLLRYALRDFDRWAGDSKRLEKVDCPSGLARGREILVRLHRQRWQDAPNAGVFRSPRFIAFHNEVMPRLLDSGALQLVWLSAHGRPVAAMYNIVWNNKIYFYQSGRDTSLPRHVRPGVVIIAKVIQTAIESGVREFDFLGGASTYKMQLALSTLSLIHISEPTRLLSISYAVFC